MGSRKGKLTTKRQSRGKPVKKHQERVQNVNIYTKKGTMASVAVKTEQFDVLGGKKHAGISLPHQSPILRAEYVIVLEKGGDYRWMVCKPISMKLCERRNHHVRMGLGKLNYEEIPSPVIEEVCKDRAELVREIQANGVNKLLTQD